MAATPTAPPAPPTAPPSVFNGGNGPTAKPRARQQKLEVRKPQRRPPRIVVDAVEGFAKTTIGAYAPSPLLIMAPGETGYDALLDAGLVPAVPVLIPTDWGDFLGMIDELIADQQGRQTLVLDALGGFERLCHEHVCQRDYKGEWSERGFLAYQQGYDVAVGDWLALLKRLDDLQAKGVLILALAHCRIETFKDPLGVDYDRYSCDLHRKTWGVTHKWADAVLFGKFVTVIDKPAKAERAGKGKAIGGTSRVLYTEHRDAFDAKNRLGMPFQIDLNGGPAQSWNQIAQHLPHTKGGK